MKYAIVESGGKQYKAVEGATIEVDRLPVEAGAIVRLEQVLLLADGENVTVGTPLVKDMTVWARALEHVKGPKLTVFHYRPKKRIRVKTGHRQTYTRLLIEQIGGSALVEKKAAPAADQAGEKVPAQDVQSAPAAKPKAAPKPKAEAKAAPKTKPAPAAKKAAESAEKKAK
ncbi:MAG: 50S ribosomal protein L21 [Anaerolineales bacterium]